MNVADLKTSADKSMTLNSSSVCQILIKLQNLTGSPEKF